MIIDYIMPRSETKYFRKEHKGRRRRKDSDSDSEDEVSLGSQDTSSDEEEWETDDSENDDNDDDGGKNPKNKKFRAKNHILTLPRKKRTRKKRTRKRQNKVLELVLQLETMKKKAENLQAELDRKRNNTIETAKINKEKWKMRHADKESRVAEEYLKTNEAQITRDAICSSPVDRTPEQALTLLTLMTPGRVEEGNGRNDCYTGFAESDEEEEDTKGGKKRRQIKSRYRRKTVKKLRNKS